MKTVAQHVLYVVVFAKSIYEARSGVQNHLQPIEVKGKLAYHVRKNIYNGANVAQLLFTNAISFFGLIAS